MLHSIVKGNSLSSLKKARQLVLVVAETWSSSTGRLRCFHCASGEAPWHPAGEAWPVMLGRCGLAPGMAGLADLWGNPSAKREGDACSPAGLFPLSALFGVREAPLAGAGLPYHCATSELKAVDDPRSAYYNQIVDQTRVVPDWSSCEDMLRPDGRYEIGAVLDYNVDPVVPGAGSCIFLHVWSAPDEPTAGCTAMARDDMLALAGWLDGQKFPVLVQLPEAAYQTLRSAWALPEFGAK